MSDTKFFAHEGHWIQAHDQGREVPLIAFEGIFVSAWSGGVTWKTTDRVIESVVADAMGAGVGESPQERAAAGNVHLSWDARQGVLIEVADGDVYVCGVRDSEGLTQAPGWTWQEVSDPSKVEVLVRMHPVPEPGEVTDTDRLNYLRKRLAFWLDNLAETARKFDRTGEDDSARRVRLDIAQLDDILQRIDGREDTYIASLKREGKI